MDTDYGTVETLLPQGEKLNSSREVEEFQENLDDSSQKKLASTRVDPKAMSLAIKFLKIDVKKKKIHLSF